MTIIKQIDWYFDFISPFAYLQLAEIKRARESRPELHINYRPLLFAGLLKQHGHKGPAEIPAKRNMTYRYCHWLARNNNIPFRAPAAHPFNPLPLLRVAIGNENNEKIIEQLFQHVWMNSADNPAFHTIESIVSLPGLVDAAELVSRQWVKDRLRENTEQAASLGLFGVPTIVAGDEMFWGFDMTAMAFDFIDNPASLVDAEYQRLGSLPIAKVR